MVGDREFTTDGGQESPLFLYNQTFSCAPRLCQS
jgi:hypothetical protein